jgi:hypothetical protein
MNAFESEFALKLSHGLLAKANGVPPLLTPSRRFMTRRYREALWSSAAPQVRSAAAETMSNSSKGSDSNPDRVGNGFALLVDAQRGVQQQDGGDGFGKRYCCSLAHPVGGFSRAQRGRFHRVALSAQM